MEQIQQSTACFKARDYRSKHLSMSDMNNCASLSYICVQDSQGARASNASRYHNLDNSWLSKLKMWNGETHFVSSNPVENYTRNNDRCYTVPHCNTEQYMLYWHSFCPRTIVAWNHLATLIALTVLSALNLPRPRQSADRLPPPPMCTPTTSHHKPGFWMLVTYAT